MFILLAFFGSQLGEFLARRCARDSVGAFCRGRESTCPVFETRTPTQFCVSHLLPGKLEITQSVVCVWASNLSCPGDW